MMKSTKRMILGLAVLTAISACDNSTSGNVSIGKNGLSPDEARAKLDQLIERQVHPTYRESQNQANVALTSTNLIELLPDIKEYPLTVAAYENSSTVVADIFTSSEKGGQGVDGLYVDLAQAFNNTGFKTSNGKDGKIAIRKIASGVGYSFILAQREVPDAYSPSNQLWVQMAQSQGVQLDEIAKVTAPNYPGVVVRSNKVDLISTNGELDMQKLLTEVTSGTLAMGYTNPYQSSTGLNFLMNVLYTFAEGDESQMLLPEVSSAFEAFQRGIPFVAQNTLQMREATVNSGVLDAFVMEYQTFVSAKGLGGYEFLPFGVRHDSPLVATAEADASEREVLKAFAQFIETKQSQLKQYNFGTGSKHDDLYAIKDGSLISAAQRLWKDKKSGGRPIAAVFIADVSGSMDGTRIRSLKAALESASGLISSKNSIGLVSFSDVVNVDLPINEFNLQHKSRFLGAVEELYASGGTATNDAVLVALQELANFGEQNPNHLLMAFVLSDGETTQGLELSQIDEVVKGMRIPVHAIAYDFDSSELKNLSGLVEASYTESSQGSADYHIGNLLNAQM